MKEEKNIKRLEMIDPLTLLIVSLTLLIVGSQFLSITSINAFAIIMPVIILSVFISNVILKGTRKVYDEYKNDKSLDKEEKNKLLFQSLILTIICSLFIFALNKLLFNPYVSIFNVTKETLLNINVMKKDLFFICSLIPFSLYMTMLARINKTRSLKFICLFVLLFYLLVCDSAIRHLYSEGIIVSLLAIIALEMLLKLVSLRRKNNEAYLVKNLSFKKSTLKNIFKEGLKESYPMLLEFIFKVMLFYFSSYVFGEEMLLIAFVISIIYDFVKLLMTVYTNKSINADSKESIKKIHIFFMIKYICIMIFMTLISKPLASLIFNSEYKSYQSTLMYSVIIVTLAMIINACMNMFIKSLSNKGREKEIIVINVLNKVVIPCVIIYLALITYAVSLTIPLSLLLNEIIGLIIVIISLKVAKK